ncbi:MAG TPA: FAD-binding oxidoreductase [Bryobacteraceae bacterium]
MSAAADSIARYLEDASGYQGEAERAFTPGTVEQVRQIVQRAAAERAPLTVFGAGTGLTGASVPYGGWVVSLERLRKLEIEPGVARCGPGVILKDLHAAAAKARQFFGPNPTESLASIGGIIGTNAGGARSFRYGSVRRHVLSLEVTFMNGETRRFRRGDRVDFPFRAVRQPATTKNSAGYFLQPDLEWIDLLAGSEGTLGIITEAELRLFPEPGAILSGVVFFPSEDLAMAAVDIWRPVDELRILEFLDEAALYFLRPAYSQIPANARAALLIEQNLASEQDEEVDRWSERLREQEAFEEESWFGFSAADRERFGEFRHTLPVKVLDRVRHNGFPKLGTDFAVPIPHGRELHNYYRRRCNELFPGRHTLYGHVGDANNHLNLLPATAEQASAGAQVLDEFAKYVVSLDGTVAAEHGIGKRKKHLLKLMFSDEEIEAMRDVKRRLDPEFLLGRGNIFEP